MLLNHFPDPDILLNKDRMPERAALAKGNALPAHVFDDVSKTYLQIAEDIIGERPHIPTDAKAEITDVLNSQYGIIV